MAIENKDLLVCLSPGPQTGNSRRAFLQRAAFAGAVGAAGLTSLLSLASPGLGTAATTLHHEDGDNDAEDLKRRDTAILIAAEIAEALAVTTYSNIINTAPFFGRLESDDQGYLRAARQEEMSHYLLEESVTGQPSPFTSFFYLPTTERSSLTLALLSSRRRQSANSTHSLNSGPTCETHFFACCPSMASS